MYVPIPYIIGLMDWPAVVASGMGGERRKDIITACIVQSSSLLKPEIIILIEQPTLLITLAPYHEREDEDDVGNHVHWSNPCSSPDRQHH